MNIPLILSIIGGSLAAIFGLIASIKGEKTHKAMHVGAFIAGIIVLAAGIIGSIEDAEQQKKIENKNNKILQLSEVNKKLSEEISDWVTGGDSSCFVYPMVDEMSDRQTLTLFQQGKNPLFDVVISVENRNIDIPLKELYDEIIKSHNKDIAQGREKRRDLSMEIEKLLNSRIENFNIGTLPVSTLMPLMRLKLPQLNTQEFFIKIMTRNGYFTQEIKQKKIDGQWKSTWQLLRHKNNDLEEIKTMMSPQFKYEE